MSYSKWGTSKWFTYSVAPESGLKEDEFFEIDCHYGISYADILEFGVEGSIQSLINLPDDKHNIGVYALGKAEYGYDMDIRKATNEEIQELIGYLKEWVEEIEDKYK